MPTLLLSDDGCVLNDVFKPTDDSKHVVIIRTTNTMYCCISMGCHYSRLGFCGLSVWTLCVDRPWIDRQPTNNKNPNFPHPQKDCCSPKIVPSYQASHKASSAEARAATKQRQPGNSAAIIGGGLGNW